MKHDFDRTHFRLTDAEQDELWHLVAPAAHRRTPYRPRLVPVLSTAAVAVVAVGLFYATTLNRAPAPPVARRMTVLDAPPPQVAAPRAKSSPTPTAAPAAPQRRLTVAPEAEGRRESAVPPTTVVSGAAPAPGRSVDALAPGVALKLPEVSVEGDAYMVEVKSATAEQKITNERLTRYAIDSVEDAVNKQAGAARPQQEAMLRSGRSGETSQGDDHLAVVEAGRGARRAYEQSVRRAPERAPTSEAEARMAARARERAAYERDFRARCWIPPRDPGFDMMYFRHTGINPFVVTRADALSTFALDVDNASYTVTRAYLERGELPPEAAVRVEEFVNFFDQGYPRVDEGDFRIAIDGAPSPFDDECHLLRVGLRARDVSAVARRPASLTFVIDVSGSMQRENRLELVKRALHVLLDELDAGDTVGIVTYTTQARVELEPTTVAHRQMIESVIDALRPLNSTNVNEGLELGYRLARSSYRPGAINRIVLCSDGVANESITVAEGILEHVRREADAGIHLTAVGFGMGNYNDVLLEKLADQGDGNYFYVDGMDEARRVFRENLTGTLQTVAKDAKVQVEFDPDVVERWRLLGYENRDVADRDFRNDAVDAGEVGAGHQVTALYEVKLAPATERAFEGRDRDRWDDRQIGVVRLRYRQPENEGRRAGLAQEISRRLTARDLSRSFAAAAPRLRLDAAVAEFAEILRGSYWARGSRLDEVARLADEVAAQLPDDAAVQEFARLVAEAARLQRGDRGEGE